MSKNFVFLGAGAIGCYAAAAWGEAINGGGGRVTLLGRQNILSPLQETPLVVTDGDARWSTDMTLATEPEVLSSADVIVLATKSHALTQAIDQITEHASDDAVLICLLNGLAPVRDLRARFPERTVLAGMVPFNVVWLSDTQLHRTGPGDLSLEMHEITHWLHDHGANVTLHDDLAPVQYGKLLLNLANAINALSGGPLYDMLANRDYRRVYAASLKEALAVYDAAGLDWVPVGPNNPRLAARFLTAPNWLFDRLVLRKQKLDRNSMTSMASDLVAGRLTEIDTINGEIGRLGALHGVVTPVNDKLMQLVKVAEIGGRAVYSGPDLRREVGL